MIARVMSVKMKPDTGTSAVEAMNQFVVRDLSELDGLVKFLVMINDEEHTSMTIAIYDTKENMLKQENSGWRNPTSHTEVPIDV